MAYDNSLIIKRLEQRGNLIKKEDWEGLEAKNAEILAEIKDPDMLDKLQTPVSVFATFESEEGYHRALYYNEEPRGICG